MLRMLSVDEFAMLVGSTVAQQALQQLTVREPQSLGEAAIVLNQYVRGLEHVLERCPQLSNVAYQKLVELQALQEAFTRIHFYKGNAVLQALRLHRHVELHLLRG
jgi:hypothetical protein